jgi:hypothetical protein
LRGPGQISDKEFEKKGGAVKEDEQNLFLLVCPGGGIQHDFDNNSESAEPCPKFLQTKT